MAFQRTFPLYTASKSSKQWISRQSRDPYVKKRLFDPAAYRSRSAFKLLEINDHAGGFLDHKDVQTVVDLGAAPGGWSQVVAAKFGWSAGGAETHGSSEASGCAEFEETAARVSSSQKRSKRHIGRGNGTVVAVDLLPIDPIPGVDILRGDFLLGSTTEHIRRLLESKDEDSNAKADVILSDMAANVSGNTAHDTQSSLEICEAVFEFARSNLRPADVIRRKKGGVLLVKFFAHPLLDHFRKEMLEPNFNHVRYIKPDSSRTASREGYFLCQGWVPR